MATLDVRDYPQGVEAARRVTLELWSILGAHRDMLTLVGGSAPPLLLGEVPHDPYVGTFGGHAPMLLDRPGTRL